MIRQMNSIELSQRLSSGEKLVLIDVRSEAEFVRGHIPNAVNIPLNELPLADLEEAAVAPVVFICQVGGRSYNACEYSICEGIEDIYNLSDGTQGWIQNGLPTE
jgi:rhodanese-related sulfurtransferase